MILKFEDKQPEIAEGVLVAETSVVLGNVKIGKDSSIWFGAVLRGDLNRMEIGESTSIQDNAVIHVDPMYPCRIGNFCTIGHNVTLHGCEIEDEVLVGMNATIMNGAKIGARAVIGSGAVIKENAVIPPRSLVLGVPGKIVKELDAAKAEFNRVQADFYRQLKDKYLNGAIERL